MERKYLFFRTEKAAIFLFYAVALLLLSLIYILLAVDISAETLVRWLVLYLTAVVFYTVSIDRTKRGLTQ